MANLSMTITNSIDTFGPAPSQWGSFVWGVDKWGDGGDQSFTVSKTYANTQTLTDDWPLNFPILISNAQSVTDLWTKSAYIDHAISFLTVILMSHTTERFLFDGAGYNYEFTGPVTNAQDGSTAVFTESNNQQTSWNDESSLVTTSWESA